MTDDTSGYITTDYEGIHSEFTEIVALPSSGTCDLYKAKRYGRWYLLKCLKTVYAADAAYQQMLRKEFEISITLQHSAVMQTTGIEDVPLPERGTARCIVAEWIDGRTLAAYLAENHSLQERRRILHELAEGIAYIHSQQVVHRDLKPSNIMVTHSGDYVKIIDFGLADTSSHAILKQQAGTLRYMPPEQMQHTLADVRTDIYSLGIIMQEMGLKRRTYNRIIARCLQPIEQRYQKMDELLGDLNSRRQQYLLWGTTALLVAGIIGILIWQVLHLQRNAAEQQLQLRILNHEIIGFSDPEAKRLCVAHWDTDGDGELSYEEAAAVDSLGNVFTGNKRLRSFDELQYFTALTAIDPGAFRDCVALQSVRLPASVRFIRGNAFRHTAIERFTFPGTVAGLGDHFLEDCPRLETVIFESRLPQNNMTEESTPFVNCPRLTTIFVPYFSIDQLRRGKQVEESGIDLETIERIAIDKSYAYRLWLEWGTVFPLMTDHIRFADPVVNDICVRRWDRDGDRQLSIDEAEAVRTLGNAFTGNPQITSFDELRFFTGIAELSRSAFEECVSLKSVKLPHSLRVINSDAFQMCSSLQSITLPDHLERLENYAFLSCDLEEIYIPASVTFISPSAFNGNRRLRKVVVSDKNPVYDSREQCNAIIETATNTMVIGSVTAFFPRSVDKMSDEPFTGYDRPSLVIPRQVKHIGQWAFSCVIDTVYCESPVPAEWHGPTTLFDTRPVIFVPKGSLDAYRQANGWSYFADSIRESSK